MKITERLDVLRQVEFLSHGRGAYEGASEGDLKATVLITLIRKENIADPVFDGTTWYSFETMAAALGGLLNGLWVF